MLIYLCGQDERKRWEDHRRKSTYLDDLQNRASQLGLSSPTSPHLARPGLPQSSSAPQLQSHPQLLAPQPAYPQPFVHPGFVAAFSGASSPTGPMCAVNGGSAAGGQFDGYQQVHMQPIQQPYTMIPTPPATPPHYPPPTRRDSPNRSSTISGLAGAESPNSLTRSQAGSDAFLAHAAYAHESQMTGYLSIRPVSAYDMSAWTKPDAPANAQTGRGKSMPSAGYRSSMMLAAPAWHPALPRSESSENIGRTQLQRTSVVESAQQKRQSQMWT